MELRHLRYFVAVAEELHFTRAAARLHIGQPPLSQQIQALEAELGLRLFVRTKRNVRLTEAGEHLLQRAREILAASTALGDELQRIARGEQGELREMYTSDQFAALLAGELDVGFVRNRSAPPAGLECALLQHDPLYLVLPEGHRLAARECAHLHECSDEAFIAYPEQSGASLVSHIQQLCSRAGFSPRVVQEAREALTQIGLVAAEQGIAVLPASLATIRVDGVRFVPLADAGASLPLVLAWRAQSRSARLDAFLEIALPQGDCAPVSPAPPAGWPAGSGPPALRWNARWSRSPPPPHAASVAVRPRPRNCSCQAGHSDCRGGVHYGSAPAAAG
ncbi:MAG: hypothetical protein BSR46_04485 [Candidatus Dactylopiibacterium carminicum]|nr:MAG: hypothetical protein BSR46_04485 [Candidatus Dactylopiibacterium carminicum]